MFNLNQLTMQTISACLKHKLNKSIVNHLKPMQVGLNSLRNCSDKAKEQSIDEDPEIQQLIKEMHQDFNMSQEETLKELEELKKAEKEKNIANSQKELGGLWFKKSIEEMYRDFGMISNENYNMDKSFESFSDSNHMDNVTPEIESNKNEFNPEIIYDFDEEQALKQKGLWPEIQKKKIEAPVLNYKRGKYGAFDVDELVDILREQKAKDVIAIEIPAECKFVDYMVIATCKSLRHVNILAAFIKKVNKLKKGPSDPFIVEEGKGSDWIAFDMKHIALHLMTAEVRLEKDLEILWTAGVEYDPKSQRWLEKQKDLLDFN